ncbi:12689_t:CDS:2 [Funneliformis caledonium]|uniref:12689_t:CDS:1 n=1 Tax=Funneliformis caledonium TaxID=1117310 RepID=A0A9N9EFD6_9GLOM|nr:12689_t:CDS:2 [Funneliformis caledonium]
MIKQCKINISLISPGVLVEKYHYGPYSHYWWQPLPNSEEITTYFPIRVKQTIKATLNNCEFIITVVVSNKDNNIFLLGYMCQCNEIVGIANDPINAISENDENIVNKLNKDVPFTSHSFLLEKIKVFVYGMGYSTNIDWHCAGLEYKSSLLHKFGDK